MWRHTDHTYLVKLHDLFEFVDVDHVDVAVGQSPHVDCRLGLLVPLPFGVTEHVALTQKCQNLTVLNHLSAKI